MTDLPPVYLVDASGFIYRAFFSRPALSATDGKPANAVVGYLEMMAHFMRYAEHALIGVVFDNRRPTWRNKRYSQYKANRDPAPQALLEQFIPIMQATDALGLPRIEFDGFEADDMIATYAAEALRRGHNVVVVSSDKDLMQLVNDAAVVAMFDPMTKHMIGEDAVRTRWGVHPTKMCDVFALAGDKSDNVPGVYGIGPKTAAELINQYGDLETVIENWMHVTKKRGQSIWEQRDNARLSKELVTLRDDAPMPVAFEALRKPAPDAKKLRQFCDWLGPNYTPAAFKEYV